MYYIFSLIIFFCVVGSLVHLFKRHFKKSFTWLIPAIIGIPLMVIFGGKAARLALYTITCFGFSFIFFSWGYKNIYNWFMEFFNISIGPFPNLWAKYGLMVAFGYVAVISFIKFVNISINEDLIVRDVFLTAFSFMAVLVMATASGLFWKAAKVCKGASVL